MSRATETLHDLPDAADRQRIREDLDETLFVEAAAGTGKTTELVFRLIALLRSGRTSLDRIVAVTFTEKAAGEMKLRLRAGIEETRARSDLSAEESERFEAALEHLELARIGTIHAFCSDMLRERPVEAGIDPLFEVAAEDQTERLLNGAFDSWFERILEDPPEGVRRLLRRRKRRRDDSSPKEMLQTAARALVEHRDFDAPWRRDPFNREAELDRVVEKLREVAAVAPRALEPNTYLAQSFQSVARFIQEIDLMERLRGRDYDGIEGDLRLLSRERHWRWRGRPGRPFTDELSVDEARALRDGAKQQLDAALAGCDADLAPRLREELRTLVTAYESAKDRTGKLDFLDLLLRARNLIRDNATIRYEFQNRFTHFLVDEFQDTDPLQVEILLLLAADDRGETDWRSCRPVRGKLFVVGDPKQSIYRFRRADIALYEDVKRRLLESGARLAHLTASFRARPAIQDVVNAAFAPAMAGAGGDGQAEYVPLEGVRGGVSDQPAVVVLPVPKPYADYGEIVKWRIAESCPDAVGAFVDWLVRKSGWTVEEPGDRNSRAPVAPRHVCVLFRRFHSWGDDVTRPYVRALEARRIPHVLVGGRSFHDREEVLALRNALVAVEWPSDELRVFAAMRGPLFALHDDALLAFRHRHGGLHPLRWVRSERRDALDGEEREVADALAVLGRLHFPRNRRAAAETVTRLLAEVRAHAGLAIWPTGEQALANCLRVVELARAFERRGGSSFRAFVERLEEEAEEGRAEEAPIVEEGSEGVRIMTVHRAKGLEFPVVILADPTCRSIRDDPSRHVDPERNLWAEPLCGSVPPDLRDATTAELRRDAEEAVRIAYVAATRARDLLVLPGVGDLEPGNDLISGWLEVLCPAIYPATRARRSASAARGCPSFGGDSVAERPARSRVGPGASVQPGLHRGQIGQALVVWWDPSALELDVEEEVGLRQERILVAAEGKGGDDGVEASARWAANRTHALEAGSRPSIRVAAVTALAAGEAERAAVSDSAPLVTVAEIEVERTSRPGGRRFGALVHAVLAAVDLGGTSRSVRNIAEACGRLLGATGDEVDAAVATTEVALGHPILRRAAVAASLGGARREVPVMLRLGDGALAEGVADLAFREVEPTGSIWTVVDFKTDRELADHRREYEQQVRMYAEAVARATGERATPIILML